MKRNTFLKTLLGSPLVFSSLSFKSNENKEEVTIFTPEMLTKYNYGLFIIDSRVKKITRKNIGYAATRSWKLVYTHSPLGMRYGLCNFLTDGWTFQSCKSSKEMVEYLNNTPYGDKYRLMTKEEVIFIISHRQ